MTTAELKITSNYIQALASQPDATERIGLFLSSLLSSHSKEDDFEREKSVSCKLTFTKKELNRMSLCLRYLKPYFQKGTER